jgi:predicted nucleotidyltransferase
MKNEKLTMNHPEITPMTKSSALGMDTGIKQELDTITKIIVDTVPVEMVYLFGSYANGTPNKDSDLDLYVVFKDEMAMRELDAIRTIRIAIYPVKKKPMDILGLKQNRFDDRKLYATLERKIVREGIKLYG